ncbi:hypothetical protein CDAR_3331 [Caerostris darwini]|uniref:C2H2-type domain-containing protein n=1 Tax=Caerostris darwini TaxID=1538125 RepID=A0AAV4QSA2_9ARAC|nr:hypothetical protein CDAR_3331 [Caerostris darwini]
MILFLVPIPDECSEDFTGQNLHHTLIPTPSKSKPIYKCPYCMKDCQFKSSLNQHLLVHTGEKPYACDFCPKRFANILWKKPNVGMSGQPDPLSPNYVKNLLSTKLKHHCQFCPKRFYSNFELVRHTRMHTGERPFVCDLCSKSFKSNQALKYHKVNAHNF